MSVTGWVLVQEMVPYGLNIKENEGGWCLYRTNWWGLKEQVIIPNHLRNQFELIEFIFLILIKGNRGVKRRTRWGRGTRAKRTIIGIKLCFRRPNSCSWSLFVSIVGSLFKEMHLVTFGQITIVCVGNYWDKCLRFLVRNF